MAQFKEHEIERPDFLGDSWNDSSWRNDACAHATLFLTPDESGEGPVVEFWVNYPDPKDREVEWRYDVAFQRTFELESGSDATLWIGEDEDVARQWARAAEIAKTIATEIVANPNLLAANTFAELRDLCDANCLGDQEAFLSSCGWTGKDDAKDEEALNASVDVLNGAQSIVDHWLRARAGRRRARTGELTVTVTRSYVVCDGYHRRVFPAGRDGVPTSTEAEAWIRDSGRSDLHVVELQVPTKVNA
jgi:hypothetical protein